MMNRIWSLVRARNLEFFRDRASLVWNILFPFLVILGFGFGFGGGNQAMFKVAVLSAPQNSRDIAFFKIKYISFIDVSDPIDTGSKLSRHQYDMMLDLRQNHISYSINQSSPKGYLLEKLLIGSGPQALSSPFERREVSGLEIRYVDWLIAGMLGMNMMFSALFGVGYSIVRYRKNGVLKRLKATPISPFEFISAQIVSRVFVIFCVSSIIFLGAKSTVHFVMLGSYFNLALVLFLGALCLISLGLLIVSAVKSEELAGGMLQLFSWPMMFLSGVWFSLEGFSPAIKRFAYLLPLTHIIEAARGIMTEGHNFSAIAPHLLVLGSLSIIFLSAASFFFRWE